MDIPTALMPAFKYFSKKRTVKYIGCIVMTVIYVRI